MNFERHTDKKKAIGIGIGNNAIKHGSIVAYLKIRNREKRYSVDNKMFEDVMILWKTYDEKELSKKLKELFKIRWHPFARIKWGSLFITGWTGADDEKFNSVFIQPGYSESVLIQVKKEIYEIMGCLKRENVLMKADYDHLMLKHWSRLRNAMQDQIEILNQMTNKFNENISK